MRSQTSHPFRNYFTKCSVAISMGTQFRNKPVKHVKAYSPNTSLSAAGFSFLEQAFTLSVIERKFVLHITPHPLKK